MALLAVWIACLSLVSLRLAHIVGFKLILRLTMILYPIMTFISSYQTNEYMFGLYYIIGMGTMLGLYLIPSLYCIWGSFPESTGNITGLLLAFFGGSTVIYNTLAMMLINPDNIPAESLIQVDGTFSRVFTWEVSKNVPSTLRVLSCIYGCCTIPGAFLI